MSVPVQFAAKRVSLFVFTSVVYRRFDNPVTSPVRAMFYPSMRFLAKRVPLIILASAVCRVDDLAARLVGAVFYSPMRFLAEGVPFVVFTSVVGRFNDLTARLVGTTFYPLMRFMAKWVPLFVFTSVVRRVDDLAARLVGAALHPWQAALAVRARTSEFVDFLDAVRAQADAAGMVGWASCADRRARWLSWGTVLLAGWSPIRLWSSTTPSGAAWIAGRPPLVRQPDENQEGEEAEEQTEEEPRAASVPFLIRQEGAEGPYDHTRSQIHQQNPKDFHDDFSNLACFRRVAILP